jgi:hypothetical protein
LSEKSKLVLQASQERRGEVMDTARHLTFMLGILKLGNAMEWFGA